MRQQLLQVLLVFGVFQQVEASLPGQSVGAVSAAMGNSGVASVEISDGPRLNPALIGFVRGYIFSTGYSRFSDKAGISGDRLILGVSDHQRDSIFPAALTYTQDSYKNDLEQKFSQRSFQLGFGNRVSSRWAFGLAANYQENRAGSGTGEVPAGYLEKATQTNMLVGSVFPITQYMGLGIVAENIVPSKKDVPPDWEQTARTAVGFNYEVPRVFQVRAELRSGKNNAFGRSTTSLGLQSFPNRWLAVRLGTARDQEEEANTYSAGLGFMGPKFGLHYAFVQSPEAERLTRHSIDLAFPLW